MPRFRHDPEGRRLPIKLDSASNGEFEPRPLSATNRLANRLAREAATKNARRSGMKRREFLVSACGAASTLLAINAANAAAGKTGGSFELDADAALDPELALNKLAGREFIFDIQGHYVDPNGNWLRDVPITATPFDWPAKARCELAKGPGLRSYLQCLGPREFIKDVFLDSDTDMMVLSFVPSLRDAEPLTIEEAAATKEIVDNMEGSHRLLLHGRVNPNQDGDLEGMDELAGRWKISAWKTYTQWGPDEKGFFLHEEPGIRLIEKARQLGIRTLCVHKGLPFGPKSYEHSLASDIGIVAKRYPDVNFIVYHSGFIVGQAERAYDPKRGEGVDEFVRSVIENDVKPNSNVYAELGSTWRMLMQDPDSAAHTLGKLFKHIGEDNVVWGTDSIWYGSPQDQIQAFRAFQIGADLREKHGYSEITPRLRAKVFGLNALRPYGLDMEDVMKHTRADRVWRQREEYREEPDPAFLTYGPKTRREFLNLLRLGA